MTARRRRRSVPSEAAVQDAWSATAGASVPIDGGRTIHVHFPGWHNRGAGPDFRDAVLEADGSLIRGDVEVHRDARDWVRHGHDTDLRYANVVLHVVANADGEAPGPSRRARAVSLPDTGIGESLEPFGCRVGDSWDPDAVRTILEAIGLARYRVAARRIGARLGLALSAGGGTGGADQVAFEEVAAALGYVGNEGAMRRCARAVPLVTIRSTEATLGDPADPSLSAMLDLAFGDAAAENFRSGHDRGRGAFTWVFTGVRPSNHPRERIAQLVAIARAWPAGGIEDAVIDALRTTAHVPHRAGARLRALLAANTPNGSREADVVLNVLLPFARAVGLRDRDGDVVAWADTAFAGHAPLSGNAVISRVAARLGVVPRQVARTGAAQQGLIAVWDGPCRPLRCDLCPLANTGLPAMPG